jgi:hypothetical protein
MLNLLYDAFCPWSDVRNHITIQVHSSGEFYSGFTLADSRFCQGKPYLLRCLGSQIYFDAYILTLPGLCPLISLFLLMPVSVALVPMTSAS